MEMNKNGEIVPIVQDIAGNSLEYSNDERFGKVARPHESSGWSLADYILEYNESRSRPPNMFFVIGWLFWKLRD